MGHTSGSISHLFNKSRRHRGHYFFHALFWNTVQRGRLFDDLPTRHTIPEHPGNSALEIKGYHFVLIDAVNATELEEVAGELLGGINVGVLLIAE